MELIWVKRWRVIGSGLALVFVLVLTIGSTALSAPTEKADPPAPAADAARKKHAGDYLPAHNFKIEIDGVIAGGFKEVSGLESEVEVIEYKDGSDPITHKRPGKTKYKNIVLKVDPRDPSTKELYAWYQQVASGKDVRRRISVVIYDDAGQEAVRYNLFEAWPCRWKAPELNASSDTHAVEEIEFVVERVERS